jgi:eukaryotic-like serine/threonine-protein kinase
VAPPATAAHDTAPMPVVPPSPPVEHAAPSEQAEPATAEQVEPTTVEQVEPTTAEQVEPAAEQAGPAAAGEPEPADEAPGPAAGQPGPVAAPAERMEAAPPPAASARSGKGPVLPLPTPVTPPSRPRAALMLALLGLVLAGGLVVAVLLGAFRADRGGETPAGKGGPAASSPTTGATPRTTAAGGGQTATTAPQQGGAAVPAGFKLLNNTEGHYAVAYPDGWKARVLNSQFNTATFRDGKTERSFEIRSKTPPAELLPASREWEKSRQSLDSYHLIGQNEGTYQGRPAVITEYTYQDKGEQLHERHVNFAIGDWGYSVVMTAREADWAAADREVWGTVEGTLRPR